MAQFEIKDGVAIIPEGTIEIREKAFQDCTSLKSIIIPESVEEIGGVCFRWLHLAQKCNNPQRN